MLTFVQPHVVLSFNSRIENKGHICASLFQFAVCLIISAPHTTPLLQSLDTVTKPKPGGFSSGKAAKKKKQPKDDPRTVENGLRFNFMEELMDRARNRDSNDVSEVIYDMIAASLNPDPRSFHGLVVSHTLNGHEEAVMESLRRELAAGLQSVHETFMALVRLFGSKGRAIRGLEILGDMQDLYYDIR